MVANRDSIETIGRRVCESNLATLSTGLGLKFLNISGLKKNIK